MPLPSSSCLLAVPLLLAPRLCLAQNDSGMNSGGLAPPPAVEPAEQPASPTATEQELTRAEFEAGARRELGAIVAALDATLERAKVHPEEVDLVCLTGGTARVPWVHQALRERFGGERLHSLSSLHAVVDGLAQQARWLLGR